MKKPSVNLALIAILIALGNPLWAQIDSLKTESDTISGILDRPQVEIGAGILTYYGEVGSQFGGSYHPFSAQFGTHLNIKAPTREHISLRLGVLFGTLAGNERSIERNLNFRSEIRMGTVMLEYDFGHFIDRESTIKPYVRSGISAFEFLSKTDLRDAEGRRYFYWDDGSIRNLPENSDNAGEAIRLNRDYSYETDLRELDLDDKGDYEMFALAIPVGVGATIKLNEQLDFRVGADMQFTFTDNIDNVSPAGDGMRKGDSQNDRFLYGSFGIAYNLRIPRDEEPRELPTGEPLLATSDMADEDDDGAADIIDLCPFTPANVEVDEYGCPVDSDNDGVPDHEDLEPNSETGAVVNSEGVTMTDEDIRDLYLAYIDSTGELYYEHDMVQTGDVDRVRVRDKRSKSYRILIGSGQEVSAEMISSMLSIPDVQTIEDEEGNTTYLVGHYDNMEEAVLRKIELENQGILGVVVLDRYGEIMELDDSVEKLESQLRENFDFEDEDVLSKVTFRVQIGAYRYALSRNIFKNVPDLLVIKGKDGITRYVSGSFTDIEQAAERKIDLLLDGFEGAFITAYKGGKRISLEEAGATLSGEEDFVPRSEPQSTEGVDSYGIQLGAFSGTVPASRLREFIELGNVRPIRGSDGLTRYVMGNFASKEAAQKELQNVKDQGYPDAMLVGLEGGEVINLK